jgi:hypothetical protein
MPLLIALSDAFAPLLKRHLPDVEIHLANECVAPIMYMTEWIMTLFLASFQFAVAVRVFDSFLAEGWPYILRVAIALLKIERATLVGMEFDTLFPFIKQELPRRVSAAALLAEVPTVKLSRAEKQRIAAAVVSAGASG